MYILRRLLFVSFILNVVLERVQLLSKNAHLYLAFVLIACVREKQLPYPLSNNY